MNTIYEPAPMNWNGNFYYVILANNNDMHINVDLEPIS